MTLEQAMELLRGQLAALTEEVRRNQCHHPRNDGEQSEDTDADNNGNFDNPFGQLVRGNQQVPVQEPRPAKSCAFARSSKRRAKMEAKHQT